MFPDSRRWDLLLRNKAPDASLQRHELLRRGFHDGHRLLWRCRRDLEWPRPDRTNGWYLGWAGVGVFLDERSGRAGVAKRLRSVLSDADEAGPSLREPNREQLLSVPHGFRRLILDHRRRHNRLNVSVASDRAGFGAKQALHIPSCRSPDG